MKRSLLAMLLLLSLLLSLYSMTLSAAATPQVKGPGVSFSDVSEDAWYYPYVAAAVDAGLVKGVSSTHFAPDGILTRAQFALMLYRQLGCPTVESLDDPFTDLSSDWYADAVVYMASMGVIKGTSATSFSPEAPITREQMVTMLYRLSEKAQTTKSDPLADFADYDQVSPYAQSAMAWAVEQEVLQGVGGGKLLPQGLATRAQASKVLCLLYGYICPEENAAELCFLNATIYASELEEPLKNKLAQFAQTHCELNLVYHGLLSTEDPYTAIQEHIGQEPYADLILLSQPLDHTLAAEGSLLPLDGLLPPELLSTLTEEQKALCTYQGDNNHMNGRLISFPLPGTDLVLVIPDSAQASTGAAKLLHFLVSATS